MNNKKDQAILSGINVLEILHPEKYQAHAEAAGDLVNCNSEKTGGN